MAVVRWRVKWALDIRHLLEFNGLEVTKSLADAVDFAIQTRGWGGGRNAPVTAVRRAELCRASG